MFVNRDEGFVLCSELMEMQISAEVMSKGNDNESSDDEGDKSQSP